MVSWKVLGIAPALLLATACADPKPGIDDAATDAAASEAAFFAEETPAARAGASFCGRTTSAKELADVAAGDLATAHAMRNYGANAAELVLGLMHNLTTRGLDFAKISSHRIAFRAESNEYVLTTGDGGTLAFTLSLAESLGALKAGEKLPVNFFARESYLRGVKKGAKGEVDYDAGPLFELIDGEVEFGGGSTEDYRFMLRSGLVRFELVAETSFVEAGGGEFRLRLETAKALTLTELARRLDEGGVELAYDASTYVDEARGHEEIIDRAPFTMRRDDSGWLWEGSYDATIHRNGDIRYVRATTSGRQQSYAELFCDLGRKTKAATAVHDLDLQGGTIALEGEAGAGILYTRAK